MEAAEAVKKREEMKKLAAKAQAALEWSERVWKYLMKCGVWEIVAKIFASDDYVFEVAGLVPNLQATGRVALLRELQEYYFPEKEVNDLPGYVEKAVDISNPAFTKMQKGPQEWHILDKLAAQPNMGVEEIKALQLEPAW